MTQDEKKQRGFINFMPLIVFALLGITFGVWKLIEVIFWLFKHVRIVP